MKNLVVLIILTGLLACSSKYSSETAKTTIPENNEEVVAISAISNYILVKDALVKSDSDLTSKAAMALAESAGAEGLDEEIISAAKAVATEESLEVQRTYFKTLTDLMIEVAKTKEMGDALFVQYCPMAFNNSGASWLSLSKEIRNPYFGDKMLKCGRVTEEL